MPQGDLQKFRAAALKNYSGTDCPYAVLFESLVKFVNYKFLFGVVFEAFDCLLQL